MDGWMDRWMVGGRVDGKNVWKGMREHGKEEVIKLN